MEGCEKDNQTILSHMALSKSISDFSSELKNVSGKISKIENILNDHGETITKMLQQTTATNGNVRTLQLWKEGLKGITIGAGACISVIILLVSFIFLSQTASLKESIGEVRDALNMHANAQMK